MWPNTEGRGKGSQKTYPKGSPWASLSKSSHQGGKELTWRWRSRGGRGMQVGCWHGSCCDEGWWQDHTSRPLAIVDAPQLEGGEGNKAGTWYIGGVQEGEVHVLHPGAGKLLLQVAVPCSYFCWQPDSRLIIESQNHLGWQRPSRSSDTTINLTDQVPSLNHVP